MFGPVELVDKLELPPTQMVAGEAVAAPIDGFGLTVMVTEAVLIQPSGFVAVTVYVVVVVGFAVTLAVLVALNPVDGVQLKLSYEGSLAEAPFKVTLPPAQNVVGPLGVIARVGGVVAVTVTAVRGPSQPAADVSAT